MGKPWANKFAVMGVGVSPWLKPARLLTSGRARPVIPTSDSGRAAWSQRKQPRKQPGIIKESGWVCSRPKLSRGLGFNLNSTPNLEF